MFQLFEVSIEYGRREVTPRGLPRWVHERLERDAWSKLIVYVRRRSGLQRRRGFQYFGLLCF